MNSRLTSITFVTLAVGCGGDPAPGDPIARTDLRAALGAADVDVVGVTVAPDGRRYVLDLDAGLVELASRGARTVIAMTAMPDPGVPVRLPYTDVVALGDDTFALTAIGDGFLLDTSARTAQLHFCYEPGFMPEGFLQRTDSVTYDPERDEIVAQPQTFDENLELVQADIGRFDRATGFDLTWQSVAPELLAGGIAIAEGTLYLGRGSRLLRHDSESGTVVEVDDLARFGVGRVEGLAWRPASRSLLVVDGAADELVEIAIDQLAL